MSARDIRVGPVWIFVNLTGLDKRQRRRRIRRYTKRFPGTRFSWSKP